MQWLYIKSFVIDMPKNIYIFSSAEVMQVSNNII